MEYPVGILIYSPKSIQEIRSCHHKQREKEIRKWMLRFKVSDETEKIFSIFLENYKELWNIKGLIVPLYIIIRMLGTILNTIVKRSEESIIK